MPQIIILSAFSDELEYITPFFPTLKEVMVSKCRGLSGKWNNFDVFISLTGIGVSASAITTTILCEQLRPDLIIFCGVAGGLKNNQQIGDLIIADQIIDIDLHQLPTILNDTPYKNTLIDPHTQKQISSIYSVSTSLLELALPLRIERMELGTIATSNIFPAPKNLFSEIKQLNCSAIEMESAGLFKAAEYYHVPVMIIRAISNLLDDTGEDLGTKNDAIQICSKRLAECLIQILFQIRGEA